MIDDNKAIVIIKKLVYQGFILREEGSTLKKKLIGFTDNDFDYLKLHHSEGKYYKERNSQIVEVMIAGFLVSASKGETFVPEEYIANEMGRSIEQNYPEASLPFLKFAKTYWSLRTLLNQLRRDDDGLISFIGGRLLGVLEGEIGPVFFPFPGHQKVPPAKRESFQREFLSRYARFSNDIDINIDEFMAGNPILIRDRKAMSKSGGCITFILVGVFTATLAMIYTILAA